MDFSTGCGLRNATGCIPGDIFWQQVFGGCIFSWPKMNLHRMHPSAQAEKFEGRKGQERERERERARQCGTFTFKCTCPTQHLSSLSAFVPSICPFPGPMMIAISGWSLGSYRPGLPGVWRTWRAVKVTIATLEQILWGLVSDGL